MTNGNERRAALVAAENKAFELFDAIEAAGLVAPGKGEGELDREITALAAERFGVKRHWHKRVVRVGANTVCIFSETPPERTIQEDDIVYLDLGPVFSDWEADVGRSYVVGNDPQKKKLVADLPRIFDIVSAHYRATPDITGAELYTFAQKAAADAGWLFGGVIAGHMIGEFPHAQIPGDKALTRIAPANPTRMSEPDGNGNEKHWILEIHLVDKARKYGGFYERLL
jgi:Xaa-Pro dipeptidase